MAANQGNNAMAIAEGRDIHASRVFDAPRELVWKMWTEPKHIARWWGPHGFLCTIYEMNVRPGGTWRFVLHGPDGTDYWNKIVYREVQKPERLAYSHVSGPLFDAVVTFTQEGKKTRVDTRMTFESEELRDKVAREFGAVEGLNQTLGRLSEQLEHAVADEDEFVISHTFDAPRTLVFDVWSSPEHLQKWFGPKGTEGIASKNDQRVGGVYHYGLKSPDGSVMWGKWVYREIVRPQRLVFVSSFSDEQGNVKPAPFDMDWPLEMLSTVVFAEHEGKTTITVRWSPLNATEAQRKTFASMQNSMNGGWTGTFEQLDEYLKKVVKR